MANEKRIRRTIITGYNYEVFMKEGNVLQNVGSLIAPNTIRSIKEQKKILVANKFDENAILIAGDINTKVYEMTESDFMKYAVIVEDAPKEKESQDQPQNEQI